MLDISYLFEQNPMPAGTAGDTSLLFRFSPTQKVLRRRPLNISLVIDCSGSMAGDALKHAIEAAQSVIDRLENDDRVSVVAFDDEVKTVVSPRHPVNKVEIKQSLRSIRAGGTTNLSGGWLEGCRHVQDHHDAQAINRVLLLTDGQANEGITDPRLLIATARKKAETGVVTTTLGFGRHFEEDLLIGMANAAGGNFYFIQSKDDAAEVFSIEMEALKSLAAQNLSVHLSLADGVTVSQCLTMADIKRQGQGQGQTLSMNIGNIFAGEDKLLGMVINLPLMPDVGQFPILNLKYSADVIDGDHMRAVVGDLAAQIVIADIDGVARAAPTGVRLDMARLKIAHVKQEALLLAEKREYAQAGAALQAVITRLREQGLHERYEIAEEIEQLDYFAKRIERNDITNETRKELRDQSFQGLTRNRRDLTARGTEGTQEVRALAVVTEIGEGIELTCVREGGKLRVKVMDTRFDQSLNIQFPRAIRAEGAQYVVANLEMSTGGFYRVQGDIRRLVRAGVADPFASSGSTRRSTSSSISAKAVKPAATLADLEQTSDASDGVLVQCVKDGSKLRARVVSDGYEPTWNMRFPRGIRAEGTLYVVEEIQTAADGKSYIASGKIRRFVQS